MMVVGKLRSSVVVIMEAVEALVVEVAAEWWRPSGDDDGIGGTGRGDVSTVMEVAVLGGGSAVALRWWLQLSGCGSVVVMMT